MSSNKPTSNNALVEALRDTLISRDAPFARSDFYLEGPANVVDGLFAIAASIGAVAKALQKLGLADASTPFGAIEHLSKEVQDHGLAVSGGLDSLSSAVRDLAERLPSGKEEPQ